MGLADQPSRSLRWSRRFSSTLDSSTHVISGQPLPYQVRWQNIIWEGLHKTQKSAIVHFGESVLAQIQSQPPAQKLQIRASPQKSHALRLGKDVIPGMRIARASVMVRYSRQELSLAWSEKSSSTSQSTRSRSRSETSTTSGSPTSRMVSRRFSRILREGHQGSHQKGAHVSQ